MYTHTPECFLTAKTDQKKKKKIVNVTIRLQRAEQQYPL